MFVNYCRAVTEMDEPHSKAERQRLKKMLCDAIRVLCQSKVRYSVQLSVEALIGITVDGGRDSLIFSLNEVVDKQAADDEGEYYDMADDNQFPGNEHVDYVEEENGSYLDAEDDIEEDDSGGDLYMQYGTVIKEEVMSAISYNNVGRSHLQQAITTSATHPYAEDSEQYYGESMNHQAAGLPQRWSSATAVSKIRTPGFGVQKRTASTSRPGVKKLGMFGSKLSQFGGRQLKAAAAGQMQPLNGEDAVSQITLYTCGVCGAQMSHNASFQRHKRSHVVAQSFGCEGCGKMIRRRDNLLKHQRGCQAYLSQFQ